MFSGEILNHVLHSVSLTMQTSNICFLGSCIIEFDEFGELLLSVTFVSMYYCK